MPKFISCDFETHLISNEHPWPKPVCLSYYDGENPAKILIGGDIPRFLKQVIGKVPLIAHNMKFEMLVTYTWYPELRPLIWKAYDKGLLYCTQVYERLIDNTRERSVNKFDLATLVKYYFKEDISEGKKNPDAWRLRYSELDGIPVKDWPKAARDYSLQDSIWAYKLYMKQSITNQHYKDHTFSDFTLNLMGTTGLLVDKERVLTLEREIIAKLKPVKDFLVSKGIYRIEKKGIVKSLGVLRKYITENFNPIYTPTGTVSTAGEDLSLYLREKPDDEILKAHQVVMEYEKVQTSYLNRLKEANPVIRTNYKPFVDNGRTSSSGTDLYPSVNIQQQPRKIEGVTWDVRNCYVPRPGYKLVSIDYAGLELAATAHQLSRYVKNVEPRMLYAINQGDHPVDMHSKLAASLTQLGTGYDPVTYEEVLKFKKTRYEILRGMAKEVGLGSPGGLGSDTTRTICAGKGLYPKLIIMKEIDIPYVTWRDVYGKRGEPGKVHDHAELAHIKTHMYRMRKEGKTDVRIRRVSKTKFQLVRDELLLFRNELMNLYPDLKEFLTETHKDFITGNKGKISVNEFGESEVEPVYSYDIFGVRRAWCSYTSFTNGMLMSTPAATGLKAACNIIIPYCETSNEINSLAEIHDEWLGEIKDNNNLIPNTIKIATMLIDGMQSVLTKPRITVEASIMNWWDKSGTGGPEFLLWKNPGEKKLHGI